jgi:hypothetical protein
VIACQKTLHNFRHLLLQNGLARTIFERATAHTITTLNLDTASNRESTRIKISVNLRELAVH